MIDFEAEMRRIAREEAIRVRDESIAKQSEAWLTIADAAAIARVATGTIRRWIREKSLIKTGDGRLTRIQRADLDAAIKLIATKRRKTSNDNASIDDLVDRRFARKAK